MSPRWIALVALFAVATMLAVVAGRLKRTNEGFMSFVIAVGLSSQIIIPDFWRAIMLAVLLLVACCAVGASGVGTVLASILIGAYYVIPGGASAIVLAVVGSVAIFLVRDSVLHLRRIERASALVPGDRPRLDVELGGKVRVRSPLTVPGLPEVRAGFFRIVSDDHTTNDSPGVTLELVTSQGVALVALQDARLTLSRTKKLDEKVATAIVDSLALAPDRRPPRRMAADLFWIEDGDAVFVVGTPVWERAAALADGYRDSPLVPVFRTTKESRVFLAAKSEEEVRLATTFEIWAWSAWGAVCAAVSYLQFARIL